jgi:hypothetical protein
MRALTRAELDRAQCAVPGCTHRDHPVMFLNQRCHTGVGVQAIYLRGPGVLVIQCRRCEALVVNVAIADNPVLSLDQRCHPGAGVEAKYLRGTGMLVIQCRECEREIANVAVADHARRALMI